MVAQLEIRDGTPSYNSQDIWVVPYDPNGPPGLPVVGKPAYLWALVHNTGMETAQNAVVTFYVADPSTNFYRNTALKIGTGNVSLDPGPQAEVLCLAAWTPTFFNGGHECILAEVFPALTTPPSPVFNVPSDSRVAQRNLSVLTASVKQVAHLAPRRSMSRKSTLTSTYCRAMTSMRRTWCAAIRASRSSCAASSSTATASNSSENSCTSNVS
jgi:hypothetical protein